VLNSDVFSLLQRAAFYGRRCLPGALLALAALAPAGLAGAGVAACTPSQICAATPPVLAMPSGPVMRSVALGGAAPLALVPHAPLALVPRAPVAPTLPSARSRQGEGDDLSGSASFMVLLAAIGAMVSLSWRRAAR